MPNLGPHLLGRKPSPPDPRDYKMRDRLEAGADYAGLWAAIVSLLKKVFPFLFPDEPVAPDPPPPGPDPDMVNDVLWVTGAVLDQDDTGHCVGFAGAGWENAEPVPFNFENAEGHRLYYQCKIRDGEPKNEDGTWVRSLAEVLQIEQRIGPYYFADTKDGDTALQEVRRWLREFGPVVFGTVWYEDMFYPRSGGYVSPTGDIVGGHAYLCIGDFPDEKTLLFQNSWGNWGERGFFKMTYATAAKLLDDDGEALGTTEIPR